MTKQKANGRLKHELNSTFSDDSDEASYNPSLFPIPEPSSGKVVDKGCGANRHYRHSTPEIKRLRGRWEKAQGIWEMQGAGEAKPKPKEQQIASAIQALAPRLNEGVSGACTRYAGTPPSEV